MRVMMLAMDYPPNIFAGIGIHVYELSRALSQLGIAVDVFVIPHAEIIASCQYSVEQIELVTIYRFHFDHDETTAYKARNLPSRKELRNIIWNVSTSNVLKPILDIALANKYDIIHMHDYFNIVVAEAVRSALGIPIINTVHARGTGGLKMHYHLRHYACLVSNKNIAVSQHLLKELSSEPDLVECDFEVITNGVSKSHCLDLNAKENTHDVVFVGRLTDSKGCDLLIRAFNYLISHNEIPQNSRLLIVGDGPSRTRLQEYTNVQHLVSRVFFLGHMPNSDTRTVIRRSLVLVAPSKHEAFGLVALEAMAEGTCVIASNTAGFNDFITNENNGLLIDTDSLESICNAIKRIFENDDLRSNLVENGFQTANTYIWTEIARKTLVAYKKCIEECEC